MQEIQVNDINCKFTYKFFNYGYDAHENEHHKSYIFIVLMEWLRFKNVIKLNKQFKKIFDTHDNIYSTIYANILFSKNNEDPVLCHFNKETINHFTSVKDIDEDKINILNKLVDKYIYTMKKKYENINLNLFGSEYEVIKIKSGDCYCICMKHNPVDTGVIIIKKLYKKIKQRYIGNTTNFISIVWATLFRYKYLNKHYMCTFDDKLFNDLNKKLIIDVDMFSSLTSCYLKYFCSAFYDLEKYFGSVGTYINFTPIAGNFLLMPPYDKWYILNTIKYMFDILNTTTDVTILSALPIWTHDETIKANTYCNTLRRVPIRTEYDEKIELLKNKYLIHDRLYCANDFNFYCYNHADPVLNLLQNNIFLLSNNNKKTYDITFLPNNYLSIYENNK